MLEYVYPKRVDAEARGLSYLLEHSTSLDPGDWTVVEVQGDQPLEGDLAFIEVKSRISTLNEVMQFFRLRTVFEP